MQTISLESNQVPESLKNGYNGRKFKVKVTKSMTMHQTYWSGGSRSEYSGIALATGQLAAVPGVAAPYEFGGDMEGKSIALKPGFAVVEHSVFQGKDMGLTFYIHPDNAPQFLPAPCDLTEDEAKVLAITNALISSYRRESAARHGINKAQWADIAEGLKERGLLRKNGSITPKGKNAISGHPAERLSF